MSEWKEWVQQFESGGRTTFRHQSEGGPVARPATCLYARYEGPHKVACNQPAEFRSADNYPACVKHKSEDIRKGWAGYIKGA